MIQGRYSALEQLHYKEAVGKKAGYIAADLDEVASLVGQKKQSDNQRVGTDSMRDSASYSGAYGATFNGLGPNASQEVREAWSTAAKLTGVNGLGDGTPTHLSALLSMQAQQQKLTGSGDVLGSSASSARSAVRKALERMDEQSGVKVNTKVQEYQRKEREFYNTLLTLLG